MKIDFEVLTTIYPNAKGCCGAENCNRDLQYLDPCFIDLLTSKILCQGCGECLRYERKKRELNGNNN